MEMAGAILALIGSVIFLLSALGLLRMPDLYNRIQTGTKATTLGTLVLLIGMSLYHPDWAPKLVILMLFILLTNPVSSHVVARAAHYIHQKMTDRTVADALENDEFIEEEIV
ncbi:MAG: monovalent cation/H(+) antiporter subunit G [Spirochaetales bacterium]|nr:monovalent cation/H(+) antiporter subunit G [Spirochaetales bacterium]